MALYKREGTLNLTTGTVSHARSDQDPAVNNLARESHVPVGAVEQLYADEIAKLTRGARIKNFLSIFALRHVRKMLLDRSVTKRTPVKPAGNPETGHPVPPSDTLLP
ncbi:MAG: DUF3562 domain-containing protein [Holophaga sp.]|nr:DUF3562 domain-containing protein [Holophaga sp.]